jgi:hypothetical protein
MLFDLLVDAPDGLVVFQMMAALELDKWTVDQAIRDVRMIFADDEINLVCDPQGASEQWLYRLVGCYEEAAPWLASRSSDQETRLRTMKAVTQSMVNNADGRTTEGRKARLKLKYFTRLIEDLEELREGE